jgi:hypothetical protein
MLILLDKVNGLRVGLPVVAGYGPCSELLSPDSR